MEDRIEKLEKTVFTGNGAKSLVERMGVVEEKEKNFDIRLTKLLETSEALTTSVSGLLKFQAEQESKEIIHERYRAERKKDKRFMLVQTIAIASIIIGVIISIFT